MLDKRIFVINSPGSSGKDEFVKLVSKYVHTMNYSTIDKVKEAANLLGWHGEKDEKSRRFLSELKRLSIEYNDYLYQYTVFMIDVFKASEADIMFIHCREPEQIERLVRDFNCYTIYISRPGIKSWGNSSDDNAMNYRYDIIIDNSGTIEDLENKVKTFLKTLGFKINEGMDNQSHYPFDLDK